MKAVAAMFFFYSSFFKILLMNDFAECYEDLESVNEKNQPETYASKIENLHYCN